MRLFKRDFKRVIVDRDQLLFGNFFVKRLTPHFFSVLKPIIISRLNDVNDKMIWTIKIEQVNTISSNIDIRMHCCGYVSSYFS